MQGKLINPVFNYQSEFNVDDIVEIIGRDNWIKGRLIIKHPEHGIILMPGKYIEVIDNNDNYKIPSQRRHYY